MHTVAEVRIKALLISGLHTGEWSTSCFGLFNHGPESFGNLVEDAGWVVDPAWEWWLRKILSLKGVEYWTNIPQLVNILIQLSYLDKNNKLIKYDKMRK
jgi:hypothetical protein